MEREEEISREKEIKRQAFLEKVESKLKALKETKEPQEILTETPTGTIQEIIEKKTVTPGYKYVTTHELNFLAKDGQRLSFYDQVPKQVYLVRNIYNVDRRKREKNLEELEQTFCLEPFKDEKTGRWKGLLMYGDLSKGSSMFAFLHEASHGKRLYDPERAKMEAKIANLETQFCRYFGRAEGEIKKGKRSNKPLSDRETRGMLYDEEKGKYISRIVPFEKYKEYLKLKAEDERYACIVPLNIIKSWRAKGIDVAPDLDSGQFEGLIHGLDYLGGYEKTLIEESEDPRIRDGLKGLFSNTYYLLKEEGKL